MPTVKRVDPVMPPGVKYFLDFYRSSSHLEAFKLLDDVRDSIAKFEEHVLKRAPKRVRADLEQARSDAIGALQKIVFAEWEVLDDGQPVGLPWKTEIKRKGRSVNIQGVEVEVDVDEDEQEE